MAMQKQERLLSRCPHVVVATPGAWWLALASCSVHTCPIHNYFLLLLHSVACIAPLVTPSPPAGRLWEFISSGHSYFTSLHALRIVVIDEADRMLTSGHFKELQVVAIGTRCYV